MLVAAHATALGAGPHWPPPWAERPVPETLPDCLVRGPVVQADTDRFLARVPAVGRFLATRDRTVQVCREPTATDADVDCFVGGAVGAATLAMGGTPALRAAALAVHGAGLLVVGPVATGVSTLTAALALRGHAVLSDRIALVTGTSPTVWPVGGEVQLWPDMIGILGLAPSTGRIVRPALAKRAFRLGPAPAAVPVRAVVALARPQAGPVRLEEAPTVGERLATLIDREWHRRLLHLWEDPVARFDRLRTLAAASRVIRVRGDHHRPAPGELAELVEETVR